MLRALLLTIPLAGFAAFADAQTGPAWDQIQSQEELTKAIAELDRHLFDSYNRCDLGKFARLIDENIEFYLDQGGLGCSERFR